MVVDKKTAKNRILYVGISMVCMTLLKKKVDHGLAAGNAFVSLLCSTRPPKTLPLCSPSSLPTSTGGGDASALVGKRLDPKKNPPPLPPAQPIAQSANNPTQQYQHHQHPTSVVIPNTQSSGYTCVTASFKPMLCVDHPLNPMNKAKPSILRRLHPSINL
jgi:hypothetical protein